MVNEIVDEVILEYEFCDTFLGKIRGLNSEEKEHMRLWFRKQMDTIIMRQPHAIMNFHDIESKIIDNGVFKGYWKNLDEAKRVASELLGHVRRYEPVPKVIIRIITPQFPHIYQIARMKSMGYLDEDIIEKAKTWGFEESKVREIIEDRINIQASFDMKAFCNGLKKT